MMSWKDTLGGGPSCITILPTYKCTAACANCCFGSHPWVTGRIEQDSLKRYILDASGYRSLQLVVFSGGECFMLGDDLAELIAFATSLGLATRCVTNAYWAPTLEDAKRRLAPMITAGLTELSISTGDQHARFVPLENIVYAMRAAFDANITVATMVELSGDRRVTETGLRSMPLFESLLGKFPLRNIHVDESPWISMDVGERSVEYDSSQLVNASNLHTRPRCTSVLDTMVINPQEELYACCGITSQQIPEMNLGKITHRSLRDSYDGAREDFMKIWISTEGPEKILAWAATIDPMIDWQNRFAHQCDSCRFLFEDERVGNVIREHYLERIPDVLVSRALLSAV